MGQPPCGNSPTDERRRYIGPHSPKSFMDPNKQSAKYAPRFVGYFAVWAYSANGANRMAAAKAP